MHGVRNEEALERYKQADIVVDQVLRDWHGIFTIEGMALGKPVVTSLDEDAVRQTEEAFGVKVPIVRTTKDDLVDVLRPLVESFEERKRLGAAGRAYVEEVHDVERMTDRLLDIYARLCLGLAEQIQRLGKHSVIYGLGGLIQRIVAVLLLPLYTRYLDPSDYGAIEVSSPSRRSSSPSCAQGSRAPSSASTSRPRTNRGGRPWSGRRSGSRWARRRSRSSWESP